MVTYPKIIPTSTPSYPKMTGVTEGNFIKREIAEEGVWPKVHVVEEEGHPKVILQSTLLADATTALGGVEPLHYWDFTTNKVLFSGAPWGTVDNTPGYSFARDSIGTAENVAGEILHFEANELRRTDKGVLIEGSRTNLFLNSNVGVTQDITVTAVDHTLSFRGTGTITLTGASVAGPLVGTGVNDTVTLTFLPTAGTLTCTVSGSCTNVQLEAGAHRSSWIPTTDASVTRNADTLRVTGMTLVYPLSLFVEYNRDIDTGTNETIAQLDIAATGNQESVLLRVNATDNVVALMTDGGVGQAQVTSAGTILVDTAAKTAGRFNTNSVNVALNGVAGTEDILGTLPENPDRIIFGARGNSTIYAFNYLQRVAVFNSALSDADLQTITT